MIANNVFIDLALGLCPVNTLRPTKTVVTSTYYIGDSAHAHAYLLGLAKLVDFWPWSSGLTTTLHLQHPSLNEMIGMHELDRIRSIWNSIHDASYSVNLKSQVETLSVPIPLPAQSYPVLKLSPWCKMSCPPCSVLSCPQTQSVVQDVLPSLLNPVLKISPSGKMSCPPCLTVEGPMIIRILDVLPSLLSPILSSNSVRVARYPALLAQSYPVLKISPSGKMSCPPCSVLSCPQTRSAVQDVQPSLLNRWRTYDYVY
jgi:hypothetical protein